jgi:flagellar protein FlbD
MEPFGNRCKVIEEEKTMIKLTRLDGKDIFLNKSNIQWIEALPDTTITILSGARIIVREKMDEVLKIIDERIKQENLMCYQEDPQIFLERHEILAEMPENL